MPVFVTLLGLFASSAFAQSAAEFINEASAKGMADIEASRLAHQKTESKQVKDYTIVVINDLTTANQHLAKNCQATRFTGCATRRGDGQGQKR